jgi:hypothetical protein
MGHPDHPRHDERARRELKLDRADAEAIAATVPAVHAMLERLESALPLPARRRNEFHR